MYQTPETVFHWLSKHLEFRQKYSAARRFFNTIAMYSLSGFQCVSKKIALTLVLEDNASQLALKKLRHFVVQSEVKRNQL